MKPKIIYISKKSTQSLINIQTRTTTLTTLCPAVTPAEIKIKAVEKNLFYLS